jgi:hypothetical protein
MEVAISVGGEGKLKTAISRLGVKDSLAYALAMKVSAIGRELRNTQPIHTGSTWAPEQLTTILRNMIDAELRDSKLFNPLFSIPGNCSMCFLPFVNLTQTSL